eukprot:4903805-Karenia_brevis.AAC.1
MFQRPIEDAGSTRKINDGKHAGLDREGSGSTQWAPSAWAALGTGGRAWAVAWVAWCYHWWHKKSSGVSSSQTTLTSSVQ